MEELTNEELERQDYVDNEIQKLIINLAPAGASISWDIEMIGAIRDELSAWIVDKLQICSEKIFYPYVHE